MCRCLQIKMNQMFSVYGTINLRFRFVNLLGFSESFSEESVLYLVGFVTVALCPSTGQVFDSRHKVQYKQKYILQYTTNFVIYAARSEQYRRAYIQYLKTTLPWLFKIGSGSSRSGGRRQRPNIFIINSVQSAPQLTSPSKGTRGSIKVDVKVNFKEIIQTSEKKMNIFRKVLRVQIRQDCIPILSIYQIFSYFLQVLLTKLTMTCRMPNFSF